MPLSIKKTNKLVWTFSAVQTGTECATCRNRIASVEEEKKEVFKVLALNPMYCYFLTKFKGQTEYLHFRANALQSQASLIWRASKGCDCLCEMVPHGQLSSTSGWILQFAEFQQLCPCTPATQTPLFSPLQSGPATLYLTKCFNGSYIKTTCLAAPRRLRDLFPSADTSLVIPLARRAVTELWGPTRSSYAVIAIKVSVCYPPSSVGSGTFYPDAKPSQVNREEIGL